MYFFKKQKVKEIFDYSIVSEYSDIIGAVELASLKLEELNKKYESARKVAIFVTDGVHEVSKPGKNFPNEFCCEMYVVSRDRDVNDLNQYSPIVFTDISSVFEHIFEND
ncbi:MAG: hypothetical protein AAFY76_26175 [Cyanobacteria bacterium J06649_11]